jgi:hypothetical protein
MLLLLLLPPQRLMCQARFLLLGLWLLQHLVRRASRGPSPQLLLLLPQLAMLLLALVQRLLLRQELW